MKLLNGKVCIITGAARPRGIGKATARLFAEHGARVAMLDLNEGEVVESAADIGDANAAIGIGCDVSSADACRLAVERVVAWAGHVDVLVNNAGVTQKRDVVSITEADYELVTDVVLRGTLLMSQAVIPALRAQRSGGIVCVSSMSAEQGGGVFGGAHYCAAKAGVLGLMRAMARELGPDNVRVNAICPGLILSDFSRSGTPDEAKHAIAQAWPLRRAGDSTEVAGACLFLASDLSSYMTGATLDVNGGAHMH